MVATNSSILVDVNLEQNDEIKIGNSVFKSGRNYNENFRERNPVVAQVIQGNEIIPDYSFIVCNYNYFSLDSPHAISDNVFAIPCDTEIFAIINLDGTLQPVNGNILVQRVLKDSPLPLPEELKRPHDTQGTVVSGNETFAKDTYVLWLKMADYEIVYTWNGEEKRAIKVHQSEIVGFLRK